MTRPDALVGRTIRYSYSPGLTLTAVVSYVAERGPDGTPVSYLVHRQWFGKSKAEIIGIDEITEVLPEKE